MFLVPLLLLASTLHAGPERAVTPPVPNASPYSQFAGEIVAGDEFALMTWAGPGVHAARIDRDGRTLDRTPIELAPRYCSAPLATRADGRWLVVWCEERAERPGTRDMVAKFVGDDGTASPLRHLGLWPAVQAIRVAFDGTHFLVAWSAYETLGALRLDRDGNVVEGPFVVDAVPAWLSMDLVAFDSGFAIVAVRYFQEESDSTIEVIRLDTNGDRVGHSWLDRTSAPSSAVDATADGDKLTAVWTSWTGGGFRAFIAREGEPLRVLAEGQHVSERILDIRGTAYVLLRELNSVRLIAEDGSYDRVWHEPFFDVRNASAVALGDRIFVAASNRDVNAQDYDLWTAVVDAALQDVRPFERFEHAPPLQEQPAVARNEHGETLAVWFESGHGPVARIVAMPLNGAGQSLLRIPITVGESLYPSHRPRVASDGSDYLVVWNDSAARVKRDGSVIRLSLPQSGPTPCITWTGEEYLIGAVRVTRIVSGRPTVWQVWMTRVSREGARIAEEPLSVEGRIGSVACAGNLFVWTEFGRVDGAFAPSGVFTIAQGPTTHPAVAKNGDRYLVAWPGASSPESSTTVVERALVNEHGTVTPVSDVPLPTGLADTSLEDVAVAPYREGYILAWGRPDLRAIALDRYGHAASPIIDVTVTTAVEVEAAIAGGDTPFVVYMRKLGATTRWRVFTRSLTDNQPRRRATRH
jgi:hypothetical protein